MKTTFLHFIPAKSTRPLCWILGLTAAAGLGPAARGADAANTAPAITVASYYFGQYHPNDPRNEKVKGKGWSEGELIKAAKPRFFGHPQPKVRCGVIPTNPTRRSRPKRLLRAQSRQPILSHSPCTIHETQPPSHPVAGRRGAHG